jgi:lactate permease
LIIPFWVVAAYDGFRGIRAVWPAALTAGIAFAIPQFLISNLHGPWLVDTVSAVCSIAAVVFLLRVWKPRSSVSDERHSEPKKEEDPLTGPAKTSGTVFQAWIPWAILTCFILLWGTPAFKRKLDSVFSPKIPTPYLNNQIQRAPPVAPENGKPEKAEFNLNLLSATGTGILLAAIVAAFTMGYAPAHIARVYVDTIWRVRFSLLTIAAMLALGNVTKFSGADATLGLALAHTGRLYPFCGTLLGWLGVALTGSDTASNVLFGSLQKITAEQQGISPILMGAANSSGGVMGKMIDAQSIVVASTATNWYGHEGSVLRFVFLHSLILAVLVGILVFLQAYIFPFTLMVVR